LFTKLKTLRIQLPPFGLLAVGLTVVTLLTALSGLWHYQYELAHEKSVGNTGYQTKKPVATPRPDQTIVPSPAAKTNQPTTSTAGAYQKTAKGSGSANTPAASAPNNKAAPTASTPASISVALSVNGGYKGSVSLVAGNTQCDVLTKALAVGIISSLDMRYSEQYKTQAVYVIDGIGDPGAVWWTYKVNGKSPPYGCSGTPAHNGDSVNWQYVKS
jgi:hypothetical protein